MKTDVAEVALALCRGPICSHRKIRPCEYHRNESKYLVKFLNDAGLEVTRQQ